MKIAVEGCAHGELEIIYETIKFIEDAEDIKVDLLICCGDFQSTRNQQDLRCMAIPNKYYNLGSFYQYYNGEKKAPILTIFIGGNHEASNYLQELPYGGWVAPNIYYLGYCGVINVNGIRIGGISGIYKGNDYFKGRYEIIPYDNNSIRSVYHIRQVDIFRLKQLSSNIDIFLSHEWPAGVCEYGNVVSLNKIKPFLRKDIESGKLGNKPCEELLKDLKPTYWFSAHLHCKFAALISHKDKKVTKFLALDKCLPKRKFLQIFDVPHSDKKKIKLSYDLEWLTVLFLSNHLLHVKNSSIFMPGPTSNERWQFTPTEEEKKIVLSKLNGDLLIPENFTKTAPFQNEITKEMATQLPKLYRNSQTTHFCKRLGISDPLEIVLTKYDQQNSVLSGSDLTGNWSDMESDMDVDSSENLINCTSMKSIILPDPINSSSEVNVTDEQLRCFESLAGSSDCMGQDNYEKSMEKVNKSDGFQGPVDSPTAKKFKRRNGSIYCNND
ncbi:lariat debranching enzyme [Agrilus planipennis]|uniref:Lariat debranching enzyme n=1 Tax=Agrilus planipennis TaxID=224129 RepID=A0A1W4XE65_AGRPL|nr:lariat debranching enzyme [Agrilus planipennis]